MGIANDDGTHEMHLASVFADGMRGASYRGIGLNSQVAASYTRDGQILPVDSWVWRPARDVVAFALVCECTVLGGYTSQATVLTRWERASDPGEEDLDAGRLYVGPEEDAMDVSDREDVEVAMRRRWAGHLAPLQSAARLEAAWRRHRQALADVDDAVRSARDAGLSWVEVGRATGMARQSARERWATL